MKKKKLMLYVWTGFAPDYTSGLAIANAESEEEARKAIVYYLGYDPTEWGTLHIMSSNEKFATAVHGGS